MSFSLNYYAFYGYVNGKYQETQKLTIIQFGEKLEIWYRSKHFAAGDLLAIIVQLRGLFNTDEEDRYYSCMKRFEVCSDFISNKTR